MQLASASAAGGGRGGVSMFSLQPFYGSWLQRFLDDTAQHERAAGTDDDAASADVEPDWWRLERTWLRWSIEHKLPIRITFDKLQKQYNNGGGGDDDDDDDGGAA